ncbi:MAG TPA: cytochrome c family protein [Xanthobacteraceae bacterium]|nr:cytochrome c family protein [Xanthobacteraceae bacterium]
MNSFEINKILGALLGTCLVLVAVHIATGAIFARPAPAKPGYEIAVKEEQPAQTQANAAPAEQPIENLLASASAERGAQVAKQCQICHNLQQGQGPKVGPDLYGIVGRPVASVPGFNYSAALKAKGGSWTFDALNKWLTNPRADVPGTNMTFAGLSRENQRADLIAYLNSLSDHPQPLPKPQSAGTQGTQAAPPAAQSAPAKASQAGTAPAQPAAPPAQPAGK